MMSSISCCHSVGMSTLPDESIGRYGLAGMTAFFENITPPANGIARYFARFGTIVAPNW
jgi:hypothetical protein